MIVWVRLWSRWNGLLNGLIWWVGFGWLGLLFVDGFWFICMSTRLSMGVLCWVMLFLRI